MTHYRFDEFWSQKAWGFFKCLSFFPRALEFWTFGNRYLKAVFCRKFVQKVANVLIFQCALRKFAQFWLIYSKNRENRMSLEIYLATITTGLLSLGLKNLWVFPGLSFFENVKKAWLISVSGLSPVWTHGFQKPQILKPFRDKIGTDANISTETQGGELKTKGSVLCGQSR